MIRSKAPAALVAACITFIAASATARDAAYTAAFNARSLALHNQHRAQHHAPPLSLDNALARGAQSYAEKLAASGTLAHSRGNYGENLYMSVGHSFDAEALADAAVNGWYNESRSYNYKRPGFSMQTGHFTQVVWKGTTKVGCGAAWRSTRYVVVCRYAPAGNELDAFDRNVLRP